MGWHQPYMLQSKLFEHFLLRVGGIQKPSFECLYIRSCSLRFSDLAWKVYLLCSLQLFPRKVSLPVYVSQDTFSLMQCQLTTQRVLHLFYNKSYRISWTGLFAFMDEMSLLCSASYFWTDVWLSGYRLYWLSIDAQLLPCGALNLRCADNSMNRVLGSLKSEAPVPGPYLRSEI